MIRVFDIKRFAIQDGDGIRTSIFLKGCPLRCKWCHNPEGIGFEIEHYCFKQIFDSVEIENKQTIGKDYTTQELWQQIVKDMPFFSNSKGGGVTISGGEPLCQLDEVINLLEICKRGGVHTALDTCGYIDPRNFDRLIDSGLVDLLLYDIKPLDEASHIDATAVSNIKILRNLRSLVGKNIRVQLRAPMIPDYTFTDKNIELLLKLLEDIKCDNINEIALLAYHNTAEGKFEKYGYESLMPRELKSMQKSELEELKQRIEAMGWRVTFGI